MRQAFYTEPADQSGWLYHRWLLGRLTHSLPALPALLIALGHSDMDGGEEQASHHSQSTGSSSGGGVVLEPLAVFSRELAMCRELDAIEPDCKWILLTTALLLAARDAISRRDEQPQQPHPQHIGAAAVDAMGESVASELSSLFDRLVLLDPMRTHYYRDVHASFTAAAASAAPAAADKKGPHAVTATG